MKHLPCSRLIFSCGLKNKYGDVQWTQSMIILQKSICLDRFIPFVDHWRSMRASLTDQSVSSRWRNGEPRLLVDASNDNLFSRVPQIYRYSQIGLRPQFNYWVDTRRIERRFLSLGSVWRLKKAIDLLRWRGDNSVDRRKMKMKKKIARGFRSLMIHFVFLHQHIRQSTEKRFERCFLLHDDDDFCSVPIMNFDLPQTTGLASRSTSNDWIMRENSSCSSGKECDRSNTRTCLISWTWTTMMTMNSNRPLTIGTSSSSSVCVVSSRLLVDASSLVLHGITVVPSTWLDGHSTVDDPDLSSCFPFFSTRTSSVISTRRCDERPSTFARRFWNQTCIRDSIKSNFIANASRA